jgi:hypothetical protein
MNDRDADVGRAVLDEIIQANGAFPSDVLSSAAWQSLADGPVDGPVPDPSILRSEWYFDTASATRLARDAEYPLLAVATPTVAAAVRELCAEAQVSLVDSSPWVSERFDLRGVLFSQVDFAEFDSEHQYATVTTDPPWYFPAMPRWIARAASFVVPGGELRFPLFGEGTRPLAPEQRCAILAQCESYGATSIDSKAITYALPRFERAALKAAGVPVSQPWRKADLVVVKVTSNIEREELEPSGHDWVEFRIDDQIVGVRLQPPLKDDPEADQLLEEVTGLDSLILDSVSQRDPRWQEVDVWFSNNAVARTRCPLRLLAILNALGTGDPGILHLLPLAAEPSRSEVALVRRWLDA